MTDYKKWDALDCEDDEDDDRKAGNTAEQKEHNHSMILLTAWLTDAAPNLQPDGQAKLVRFISLQDLSWAARRQDAAPPRSQAVIDFLERDGEPDFRALVALCCTAKRYSDGQADPRARAAASRALIMAMGCLNTLQACRREGGARKLFDRLQNEPHGELKKKLEKYEYAAQAIGDHPELGKLATTPPASERSALSEPAQPAQSAREDKAEEALPLPPMPKVTPWTPPVEKTSRGRRLIRTVAKVVLLHLAFASFGIVIREVYARFQEVPGEL